ncbi:DNA ligase [Paenibacillus athensensis]|uniref:DNA ligase (ATP) n=1 Tax=Paenibacillus athensensis TaxID=1967502 RepID=A0A4Y8Q647_9BACL|nr:DNA ligase [Paenibacillus athensensis]MCD1259565.1 DNA ligase [Paenibacillus athensensis]
MQIGFEPLAPMEPQPADDVPAGDGWQHQIKWDGVRMLVYGNGGVCRLFNRRGGERTLNYPELVQPQSYCRAGSFILDGEIIALGGDGKPSFHEVMRRDGVRRADRVEAARRQVKVAYMAFDLLYADGDWLLDKPLAERQQQLERTLIPSELVQPVAAYDDGAALMALMRQTGMEGVVSKKRDSVYKPGGKSADWLKIKHYRDLIGVIGGYTLNGGQMNALLIGLYDVAGGLHFIGHVGPGRLNREQWRGLSELLLPTATADCPFVRLRPDMRQPIWVTPQYTAKLQFADWRPEEGRTLRQPLLLALTDLPPRSCVFQDGRN